MLAIPPFQKTISINAPLALVWKHLTTIEEIQKWMLDEEMEMEMSTSWEPGSPMMMRGNLHGIPFTNEGRILNFVLDRILEYSHLSSLSLLPHTIENHSIIRFELVALEHKTILEIAIRNFPTIEIYKHLEFYWSSTLVVFKKHCEDSNNS